MKNPQNALSTLLIYRGECSDKGFSTDVMARLIQKLEHS